MNIIISALIIKIQQLVGSRYLLVFQLILKRSWKYHKLHIYKWLSGLLQKGGVGWLVGTASSRMNDVAWL